MTDETSTPPPTRKRKKPGPAPRQHVPHPLLIWLPDGGSGLIGLRSRTIFVRIAWTGSTYKIVPTFPLPRGSRVLDDADDDIERAKRKAEHFFTQWLRVVGLTADPTIEVPVVR
jgi:hypothetical protein